MSKPITLSIDIISDTICPFCFVGKRKMEAAISQFKSDTNRPVEFSIKWHPFYLGPPDGEVGSKMQRYTEKFGAARMQQMIPYMKQVGAQVGINFDYNGPVGPTYLSHRLLQYVQEAEPASTDLVVNSLFHSYFENQGNIFTTPTLVETLKKDHISLDYEALDSFMNDPAGRGQIDAQVMDAQRKRVNGVPDFTIQGKYHLNGAQDPPAFIELFKQALAEAS